MPNFIYSVLEAILDLGYILFAKPLLFAQDPEKIHDRMISFSVKIGQSKIALFILKSLFSYENKILENEICGLKIKNPIGLAAGFDKDAETTLIMPSIGFGFMEVGSITGKFCDGNAKPRLWRLPKSKSLVVYYGLKNKGCDEIVPRLEKQIEENGDFKIPVGLSVAMTNIPENGDVGNAISDYYHAFETATRVANYITINISCPNITCEEEKLFLRPENLDKLLTELDKIKCDKPVFVKMSPDLNFAELDQILAILEKHRVHGIICSNLTKKRDPNLIIEKNIPEFGGISGVPVREASNKLLAYLYKKVGHKYTLIGCGGIFSAADAYKKIRLGASALQMITGMIYQGPQTIAKINRELAVLLKKDGFKSIKEAVGVDNL